MLLKKTSADCWNKFQNLILFYVSTVCKHKIEESLANVTWIQLQTLVFLNALDDLIAKYKGFLNPSVSFKNPCLCNTCY